MKFLQASTGLAHTFHQVFSYATLDNPVLLGVMGGVADRLTLYLDGVGVGMRDFVPVEVSLLVLVTLAVIVVDAFPVCDEVLDRVGGRECVAVRDALRVAVAVRDGLIRMPAMKMSSTIFIGELAMCVEVTFARRTHMALNGDHA